MGDWSARNLQLAADGTSSISNTSPYGEVYSFFPLLLALGAYWGLLAVPGGATVSY
jgi:hypothetical protein